MQIAVIILFSLTVVCLVLAVATIRRLKADAYRLSVVVNNMQNYAFLVDAGVNVCLTNYYKLNPKAQKAIPNILGNVLRCKNGCDAGCCGTHTLCASCAIRHNIVKSFKQHDSFQNIEAHMQLYDDKGIAMDADVLVNGKYVQIDSKPYMVVTVKDITALKQIKKELQYEKKQTEVMRQEKNSFIRNIEVQLRNPLNAIVGFAQMLSTAESDERRDYCLRLIKEYNNILVNQFNDLVKVGSAGQMIKTDDSASTDLSAESATLPQEPLPTLLCSLSNPEEFESLQKELALSYQLQECKEGNELLSRYLVNEYAGIVIDDQLPDVAPNDLADAMMSINSEARIYVLTHSDESAVRLSKKTFTGVLHTPLTEQEISHYFG